MIELIRGELLSKGEDYLIIQSGNFGIKVWTTSTAIASLDIGEISKFYTDLILRENDINLYGFQAKHERDMFRTLIKINGVGPRAALSILTTLPIENVYQAVKTKNAQMFISVPGIGNKTAQKIILYLEDALKPILEGNFIDTIRDSDLELQEALVGLGYSITEAQAGIQSIPDDAPGDLEIRLRLVLQNLSK